MSIQKRLVLSNIAMIVVPILSFFLVDILWGLGFIGVQGEPVSQSEIQSFTKWRFAVLLGVIVLTNGLLTYMVSKSIIKPVKMLTEAAAEIRSGNLDYSVERTGRDELGELAETFEEMRIKLKKSDELQKQYEENRKELIASISHDLKTPLTSMQGYVKGLLDGVAGTPEKTERYLHTIDKKAGDLDKLIDELFLYSKLDLEREQFHMEAVDLHAYFSDYLEELEFSLPDGSVRLDADAGKTFWATADREKLKRVIDNILQNAYKYMDKENPEIRILLQEYTDKVEVRIQDNGSGISGESLLHIFDSFYRADASRNSGTGGSGLGLAIAKRIIERHGGEIWAESEEGAGTVICFTLKKL